MHSSVHELGRGVHACRPKADSFETRAALHVCSRQPRTIVPPLQQGALPVAIAAQRCCPPPPLIQRHTGKLPLRRFALEATSWTEGPSRNARWALPLLLSSRPAAVGACMQASYEVPCWLLPCARASVARAACDSSCCKQQQALTPSAQLARCSNPARAAPPWACLPCSPALPSPLAGAWALGCVSNTRMPARPLVVCSPIRRREHPCLAPPCRSSGRWCMRATVTVPPRATPTLIWPCCCWIRRCRTCLPSSWQQVGGTPLGGGWPRRCAAAELSRMRCRRSVGRPKLQWQPPCRRVRSCGASGLLA